MIKNITCVLSGIIFLLSASAQQKNLDYYLTLALQNSPLLKDYHQRVQSNVIDSLLISAGQKPQVSVASVNSYAPVISGWGYDEAITNGTNISSILLVTKSITGRRNLENRYHSIELQNEALRNSNKISEQELKKNVTDQYIIAYAHWQQYLLDNEVLEKMQTEEQILKRLAEKGAYKQTDYLSFRITVDQQIMFVKQDEKNYRISFSMLNYLCGTGDTSFVTLPDPDLTVEELPTLQNSVFYQQFVADSLALVMEDRQFDFTYNPKFSLYADAGYVSSLVATPWRNFGVSAGFSLSVPVYDGNQRKLQHQKMEIAQKTNGHYRDFFEKQYYQKINQLYQQLDYDNQIVRQDISHIALVRDLMDSYHKLMNTGDVSVVEYYMAINNYLNAGSNLIQNKMSRYQVINEINYWNRKK